MKPDTIPSVPSACVCGAVGCMMSVALKPGQTCLSHFQCRECKQCFSWDGAQLFKCETPDLHLADPRGVTP